MSRVTPRLLKGFRDYLPSVELARQTMLGTVREVFESYGFGPLTTPAIEYSEILLGKYGEEGEKLLYRFEDNGGRDVALRYDLTVPLARVVGQYQDIPRPFRRYQIAPVWRAEKPARGRFREFMQCDVDIIGEPSMRADVEVMAVGLSVLKALGVPAFVMRVNNRKILDGLLDTVGIAETERRHGVLRIIDKLPKVGRKGVDAELIREIGLDQAAIDMLFNVLGREVRTAEALQTLQADIGHTESGAAGIAELTELLETLTAAGFADAFEVDLSIARGLDYYTATIYETFLVGHEEYGSVMSGGRYDTLIGTFSKTLVPAVGISLGVDRLVSALMELGLLAEQPTPAHVFIALFDDADYAANMRLAAQLRVHGINSELSLKSAKLGKQFKLAERKGHRIMMLAGADEHARGEVKAKDLTTGEQRTFALADIEKWGPEFAASAIGNKD